MRIVFMGTPAFAVPSLERLARDHEVALVVTRPDAVRGRGKRLVPSPVKARAQELGLEVIECTRMTDDVKARLADAAAEFFCVAAFGCILPDDVLAMPRLGCVNVHASLLPRYRGAAPVQRAILAGDPVGVSIMAMAHDLDAGDYCAQATLETEPQNVDDAFDQLGSLGADILAESLKRIADGSVVWTTQDESLVTFAAKVSKAEMLLDPELSAVDNLRRVRASADAAPARASVGDKGVRVTAACLASEDVAAGEVLALRKRVLLGCSEGALELVRVKPDGKREMDVAAWAAGLHGDGLTWRHV